MTAPSPHKRTHGQFFTEGNPFIFTPFAQWLRGVPGVDACTFLEPFAGSNNIIKLMREAGYAQSWTCFDIDPPSPISQGEQVLARDTLSDFPSGFEVVITNPPYLASNSAARRGLPYPKTHYDDLYKHALDITLRHVPYVAAIIPESFIVSGQFHERLWGAVSLTSKMFNDTDCPVCLALFVPQSAKEDQADFALWDEDTYLGQYKTFASVLSELPKDERVRWKFNDPQGELGLLGVDNTKDASIRFVRGATIPSEDIKHSSRAISRISGVPENIDLDQLIARANVAINQYRVNTHDTLMTSFKGLRADGKYRRRMDFAAARRLLDHCIKDMRRTQ